MSSTNQDWQEEKLKELFQEQKRRDERLVRSFAKVWEEAVTQAEKQSHPQHLGRLAMGVALFILVVGAVMLFFRKSPEQPASDKSFEATVMISQWRSPTEFLLRLPNEHFLKTVPPLGKSFFGMKSTASSRTRNVEEL